MAPNGVGRKTPAPASKTSGFNFVSQDVLDETFNEQQKKSKVKVKDDITKKLPKVANPGKWDSEVTADKDMESGSPTVNLVPSDLSKAFSTGRPMEDKPDVVKCNHCKRAILKHRAKAHIDECLSKKQEKQRKKKEAKDARDAAARKEREKENGNAESESPAAEGDEIGPSGTSKTAKKTDAADGEGATKGKKRKADDGGDAQPKKKKKKDEPKAKAPRPKAPVDVEKQCGVELPQGGQCARSLTCKSHSMGAKRAVPGRSAPYDKLLAEYQRKNQAKLQKAALESQPLLPDDDLAPTGPIDSEEEKDLVMAAIARSRPQPIWQAPQVPLRSRYQHVRLREAISNALGSRGGGGLFGTGSREEASGGLFGGGGMGGPGGAAGGEGIESRRGNAMPGRGFPNPGAARKASVSSLSMAA